MNARLPFKNPVDAEIPEKPKKGCNSICLCMPLSGPSKASSDARKYKEDDSTDPSPV